MEKKQEIFKGIIKTDIYDMTLKDKIYDLMKNANIEFDSETYYRMEIRFDFEAYQDEKLNSIEIKSGDNKERIYQLLNNQLSNIREKLKEKIEASINSINIVGAEINNRNKIEISIMEEGKKEYNKNGKLKETYGVNTIMPSEPFIQQELINCLTRQICEEIKNNNKLL